MAHEKVKASDFHLSPRALRNVRETCPSSKHCEEISQLIPSDGKRLKGRFEIRHAKEDHSDGIDDRRGCAAGGAGGCIYFAKDLATGRDVAIKFYSPLEPIKKHDGGGDAGWFQCDPDYSNRKKKSTFKKEQEIVAELSSLPSEEGKYFPEYIAKGFYRKRPYYVMEKLQALTPAQYADEKACEKIILEVCRAAQILSNHGKIALDIKPDNIMFRPADKHFVLVDMGLVADKDAYQKVSHDALEKYNSLSLSASGGTPGFFSPLYSPHHEARMIYAIGSIIDSFFWGRTIPPVWHDIVTRCHRLDQDQCFKSLKELEHSIRSAKSRMNSLAKHITHQNFHGKIRRLAANSGRSEDALEISWAAAILASDIKEALTYLRNIKIDSYKQYIQEQHPDFIAKISPLALSVAEEINKYGKPITDMWQMTHGEGWTKDDSGRIIVTAASKDFLFVDFQKGFCNKWTSCFIKEPVVIANPMVVLFCGTGNININIDLITAPGVKIILGKETTLINRTSDINNDFAEYHLGSLSYLNFLCAHVDAQEMIESRVYHSLYGPSFWRVKGPATIGELLEQQTFEIMKSQSEVSLPLSIMETTLQKSAMIC